MGARQTALAALIACRKQGAWSDGVLNQYLRRDRLDAREAALATRLCYGVRPYRQLLDFYLDAYLTAPRRRLQPITADVLRLGAYQLTQMDKIPVSAAVNESVELAKKYVNPGAAGRVNAVLRALARNRGRLPAPPDLATRYSFPPELVQLLTEQLPEGELEGFLAASNEPPAICAQVNTLRARTEEVRAALAVQGVQATPHPWLADCLLLGGTGDPSRLPVFQAGELYIQDPAAHLAALALDAAPGARVLDCCAAPGGKSFAAAIAMRGEGEVLSCDIHPHKLKLIEAGAKRLGLRCVRTRLQDASQPCEDFLGAMDCVLADVPCSGYGVIRKKPDIRYKPVAETARLPEVQLRILNTQAAYVRPGGVLVYATCTVLRRENEDVVTAFLAQHPEFTPEPIALPAGLTAPNEGLLTLYPQREGTDGFFLSRLRRRA